MLKPQLVAVEAGKSGIPIRWHAQMAPTLAKDSPTLLVAKALSAWFRQG